MVILEELLIEMPRSSARINQEVRVWDHQHRVQRWQRQAQEDLEDRLLRIRGAHEAELASLVSLGTKQVGSRVDEVRPLRDGSRHGAILCGLGIHGRKWEYVTEGDCGQAGVCRRCGNVKARIKHRLEWRYVNDGACLQLIVCGRCVASKDSRTRHAVWSDSWEVGRYRSAHRCQRCGVVETWDTGADD